jgi:clan AA aspartic protease (TIGR02281 family)
MVKATLAGAKGARRLIFGLCALLLLVRPAASEDIQLVPSGGVYMVPVRINGAITIPFVLDSGAAEIVVPEDVFKTLIRTGTVTQSDFLTSKTYVIADGSKHLMPRFVLHELRVGDRVVKDAIASVAPDEADSLLGQSFLQKLPAWTMDNTRHVLVFGNDAPSVPSRPAAPRRFYVQAGAFSVVENAYRAHSRLTSLGTVEIVPVQHGGTMLYRVRLGPVATEAEANQLRSKMIDYGFPDASITEPMQ